jgi:hypothetical protein
VFCDSYSYNAEQHIAGVLPDRHFKDGIKNLPHYKRRGLPGFDRNQLAGIPNEPQSGAQIRKFMQRVKQQTCVPWQGRVSGSSVPAPLSRRALNNKESP